LVGLHPPVNCKFLILVKITMKKISQKIVEGQITNKTCHNLFKVDANSDIASDRRYLQLVTIAMKIGFLRLTTVVNYAMPHNGIRADFPLKSWMVGIYVLCIHQRH